MYTCLTHNIIYIHPLGRKIALPINSYKIVLYCTTSYSDYISRTPRSWKRVFVVGYSRSGTNGHARYCGRESMGPSNNDSQCVYVRTWRIHSMRRVWGYVNETTGFGNMWFALKMSEPVPYFSLNRMAGRDRGNFLMLRTVLQDFKKSIGIFWINQYFIALRFLNETQRLIAR